MQSRYLKLSCVSISGKIICSFSILSSSFKLPSLLPMLSTSKGEVIFKGLVSPSKMLYSRTFIISSTQCGDKDNENDKDNINDTE